MRTFTARATRTSSGWWAVDVPELDGVYTQARRLDQVEAMARDAIALVLDVEPDSFEVVTQTVLGGHLEQVIDELQRSRTEAEVAATIATLRAHLAVRLLHDQEQLPMRDIGKVLGVSHQRIHQLLTESASEDVGSIEKRLLELEHQLLGV